MKQTVSEQLVGFMRACQRSGVPADAEHEAQRLLLNQLKASVGAVDHDAVRSLHEWALMTETSGAGSRVLWFGSQTSADRALVVNGALFEVLDFNDTYVPAYIHATSAVLPAALATADQTNRNGRDLLAALAIGIEVELACAAILIPTGYYRGFVPGGLAGGIGAAASCSLLRDMDDTSTCNALGLAMCTAFGTYESVGSMALPYIVGFTARSGYTAAELARLGIDAPRSAFEGDKGMLRAYSDEKEERMHEVLATLGDTWRIHGQSYKTIPTETITHAPIECVMKLLERSQGRKVERMTFRVERLVVDIADERMERFGNPSSELTARFDLRYCCAAAWLRERFTLAEMREDAYMDEEILALRSRIGLVADDSFPTFNGAALEILYTDGSKDSVRVDAFVGSAENRMTDDDLSQVFRTAAEENLTAARIDEILDTTWALKDAADVGGYLSLLKLDKR
jgi:2-methylcitrate dehydratase PrpD